MCAGNESLARGTCTHRPLRRARTDVERGYSADRRLERSRRGTEGGYVLTRPPSQITVGDVIRAMSGPFVQLSCLESGNFADNCGKQDICQFKPIWAEVDRAIGSILNNVTFEELVRRSRIGQRQLMYHI